jgi:site-specific DNA-methyltransferase (adenine-specific)
VELEDTPLVSKTLFSSASAEWATPQDLFDSLDADFHFTLDAAANDGNHKCGYYLTGPCRKAQWCMCGLCWPWAGTVWLNPPYGRGVDKWVAKAKAEMERGVTTVMLLPARTDTKWFHEVYGQPNIWVDFIKGRLKFGGQQNPAPFPSMTIWFDGSGK